MAAPPLATALAHAEVAALLQSTAPPAREAQSADHPPVGWSYLDVRTPEEFATGHIPGAYNIPYQLGDLAGLRPNPEFVRLVRGTFQPAARLVLGCRSGGRAAAAERALRTAGFSELRVHSGSLAGATDAFGQRQPGWIRAGYPLAESALPGRTYAELQAAIDPGPTSHHS